MSHAKFASSLFGLSFCLSKLNIFMVYIYRYPSDQEDIPQVNIQKEK